MGAAFSIYILATLLWVNVLKTVPLSRAYMFMSLSFVLVPVAGILLFGEQISLPYIIGSVLVVVGLLLASMG